MTHLRYSAYLDVMDEFREQHQLPPASMSFLIRYRDMLHQVGIYDPARLQAALAASRTFDYDGWPPVRLLQLLIDDPQAAEARYGSQRNGIPA